ncbi:MAG: hypothetical protein ACI9AD_000169 [Nitriliruptoraceae bacterium]|jgi:hypothetical protein
MDDPGAELVRDAQLDAAAAATVAALDDDTTIALAAAWSEALRTQDRALHEAVDGALGMLPRLLRRQVLKFLGTVLS